MDGVTKTSVLENQANTSTKAIPRKLIFISKDIRVLLKLADRLIT